MAILVHHRVGAEVTTIRKENIIEIKVEEYTGKENIEIKVKEGINIRKEEVEVEVEASAWNNQVS